MSNLEQFKGFAKYGSTSSKATKTTNVVIYTRVSTKEQADNNKSLETQKKFCLEYAQKHDLNVIGEFGGTYESAKNDERKEFQRMLGFVKKSKEKISLIIVYSVDRFSRSGANAIYIADVLKKTGINVLAVTQPTDSGTASGSLHQNIQFIFSQYDNDLRREKCIAGMSEKLRSGWWTGRIAMGYDQSTKNGQTIIVINEKGEILRKAFLMKANEGLSNTEIVLRCKALGLTITLQRLTEIFRNTFYCGIISHNLLNGEIVQGKHEGIISEKIFLKVNNLNAKHPQGYSQIVEDDNLPLKKFVKCDNCGSPMTGYIVKKKHIHYYKCNKIGCCCNVNSKKLHTQFEELMSEYNLDANLIEPLKEQLKITYHFMNHQNEVYEIELKGRLKEIQKKIDGIEEKYVLGDLDKALFEKYTARFKEEMTQINFELQKVGIKLSNLDKYIDFTLKIASKLNKLWVSGNYQMKQKLQYLMFPDGISFNKKEDIYRTDKINAVFSCMSSLVRVVEKAKSGQIGIKPYLSALVAGTGVEPVFAP